jgi:2-keto-4-pentenoate hydratase
MTTSTSLAEALLAARMRGQALDSSALPPATPAEAFGVQGEISRRLGASTPGWKVAIGPENLPLAAPMFGPMLDPGISYAPTMSDKVGVEIELAIQLATDLQSRPEKPYSRAEILNAIKGVYLGVEFVETRLAPQPPVLLHLADNMAHGAYVVGPALSLDALEHVSTLRCVLRKDGEAVYDKPAVHANIDPLAPVIAYATQSGDTLGGFKAGQIITTGSLCGAIWVDTPGEFVAEIPGLGSVAFKLDRRG